MTVPSLSPQNKDSLSLVDENFIAVIFVFYTRFVDCLPIVVAVFSFTLGEERRNDWSLTNYINGTEGLRKDERKTVVYKEDLSESYNEQFKW